MRSLKRVVKKCMRPGTVWLEDQLHGINRKLGASKRLTSAAAFRDIKEIKHATLRFIARMRVNRGGKDVGYRFSESTTEPLLYCTLAALLLKHLYGVDDPSTPVELEMVRRFQGQDGLFRDPLIECRLAETEDWWGWRHLTLHALMTLALYNMPAQKEIQYLHQFFDKDRFRDYLQARDWGSRVDFTSNELQNIGVMLQYARDYQNLKVADSLLEVLYDVIGAHQDKRTGLFGHKFDTAEELAVGAQAGYHFWLLYFYDKRPVPYGEAIIDSLLKTQNLLGGFGVNWNSTACEDIDSIDPLMRLGFHTDYRRTDVQNSLARTLPAVLSNLNGDGGWVFCRHEELQIVHPQMYSGPNESNLFYTWFRTLGLAYCLTGLGDDCPTTMRYEWRLSMRAPGHQFL
jgi:hypothetical protein